MTTSAAIIRRRRARKERKQAAASRNRWRIGIITFLILFLVVIPAGITLGGALVVYQNATRSLPTPRESLSQAAMIGLTELYDRSGETLLLADQTSSERAWLTLAQMPAAVLKATLRAEQPNFLNSERPNVFVAYNRLWENTLFGPLAADQTLTGRLVRSVIAPLPEVPNVDAIGR